MVNVTKTAFGDYGYVLGGGPGNYTGYGYNVLPATGGTPNYQPQRIISGDPYERSTYRARLLQTTNLASDYVRLPRLTNATYVAHGLVHQGQLRPRRSRAYKFPSLPNDSSRTDSSEERAKPVSTESQKSTFVLAYSQRPTKNKPFVLPEVAKRTAGVSTISTVFHPGFAKGVAASRAHSGSLVNALREMSQCPVHHKGTTDGHVRLIPECEDSSILVPHGYDDFHYTTLDNLKKKRLKEAYIGTSEVHRKRRSEIVKQKLKKAEWVRKHNLYADHLTATMLGIRPREPIKIPTATMDPDYGDDLAGSTRMLKAVEQARLNIPSSYLNVWNLKRRDRHTSKDE